MKVNQAILATISTAVLVLGLGIARYGSTQHNTVPENVAEQIGQTGNFTLERKAKSPIMAFAGGAIALAGAAGVAGCAFPGFQFRFLDEDEDSLSEPKPVLIPQSQPLPDRPSTTEDEGFSPFLSSPWDEDDLEEPDDEPEEDEDLAVSDALDPGDRIHVLLGEDQETGEPVYYIPEDAGNGFLICLGNSGGGKTEFIKVAAHSLNQQGIPAAIIDFAGDIRVEGVEEVKISPDPTSDTTSKAINPFVIPCLDPDFGGPAGHKQTIIEMIKAAAPVGHRQENVLRTVLDLTYGKKGIEGRDKATWGKPAPTVRFFMGVLMDVVHQYAPTEETPAHPDYKIVCSLEAVCSRFFGSAIFSGPEFDMRSLLDGKSARFNLKFIKNVNVRGAIARLLVEQINGLVESQKEIPVQITHDRERYRLFLLCDEAKILFGKKKDDPFGPANRVLTEMRKFGLGFIGASQQTSHFSDEAKAQVSAWVVFKHGNSEEARKATSADTGIPVKDLSKVDPGKGRVFYVINSDRYLVQIKPLCDRLERSKGVANDKVIELRKRA